MTVPRGVIRNEEFAKTLKDFSGMRFGTVTPTDIDGFIEFGNKNFILIELKHGNSPLPYGQKLALERLVDSIATDKNKNAILIVGSHNAGPAQRIDTANCLVKMYRSRNVWHYPERTITVKTLADAYLKFCNQPKEVI